MLDFRDFKLSVDKRLLFAAESITLSHGLVAIVGRNGAGKSTFFRAILGTHLSYNGTIKLNNQPISDFDTKILSKKIAIVNTKPTLFGKHTVSDVLFLGRLPYQNMFASKSKEDEVIVQNVIDKLGLSGLKNELFTQLSDGEKQLVMIGRALVQDTQIILLDEPSAFLDVVNQFKILEILAKISIADKKLILFSTHQIESLQQYCEKVLLISNNEMKLLQNKQNYSALIKASFGINNY